MQLSYRIDPSSNVVAAYSGAIRIGYVGHHDSRWIWSVMHSLHKDAAGAHGVAVDETTARSQLEDAFQRWLEAANLTPVH